MVYTFLIKNPSVVLLQIEKLLTHDCLKNHANQLPKNFEKQKVRSSSVDHILGENLADMKLISKFNKGF